MSIASQFLFSSNIRPDAKRFVKHEFQRFVGQHNIGINLRENSGLSGCKHKDVLPIPCLKLAPCNFSAACLFKKVYIHRSDQRFRIRIHRHCIQEGILCLLVHLDHLKRDVLCIMQA